MGFSISWIATSGADKDEILSRLELRDTGEPDEVNESPISGAELPDGCYVVFLNDFDHPLTGHSTLQALSRGIQVVSCRVEEHVMFSAASYYSDGRRAWAIRHDSEQGLYYVSMEGSPPSFAAEIHDAARAKQNAAGGEDANVDHIFDVPLDTAARICGYRHDQWKFPWGEPEFTQLIGREQA